MQRAVKPTGIDRATKDEYEREQMTGNCTLGLNQPQKRKVT